MKCTFFEIGHLINLNRSVRCPIIKNFDRTKGKIWPVQGPVTDTNLQACTVIAMKLSMRQFMGYRPLKYCREF